jgi:hypothetical protein
MIVSSIVFGVGSHLRQEGFAPEDVTESGGSDAKT